MKGLKTLTHIYSRKKCISSLVPIWEGKLCLLKCRTCMREIGFFCISQGVPLLITYPPYSNGAYRQQILSAVNVFAERAKEKEIQSTFEWEQMHDYIRKMCRPFDSDPAQKNKG